MFSYYGVTATILWSNSLLVKMLDFQFRGPMFKPTGWLQGWLPYIFLRSIEWVPESLGNLVVKRKLPSHSWSWTPSIKRGYKVFVFFQVFIWASLPFFVLDRFVWSFVVLLLFLHRCCQSVFTCGLAVVWTCSML